MKTLYQSLLLSIGALALAGAAFSQMPSTNDTSTTDDHFNTGMGTGALGTTATNRGFSNTASGYKALNANTTGGGNTADGYAALFANTAGGGNTAAGSGALSSNTTGFYNTASG
jgi:hypothetical protein